MHQRNCHVDPLKPFVGEITTVNVVLWPMLLEERAEAEPRSEIRRRDSIVVTSH